MDGLIGDAAAAHQPKSGNGQVDEKEGETQLNTINSYSPPLLPHLHRSPFVE